MPPGHFSSDEAPQVGYPPAPPRRDACAATHSEMIFRSEFDNWKQSYEQYR
jgi:hypothetical protein